MYCLEPQAGKVYWGRDIAAGWYKFSDKTAEALLAAGCSQAVLNKLERLKNREFMTREQFVAELAKTLDDGDLERYQKLLVDQAHVRFSQASCQLWSAPAVSVTADGKTQVRRVCFGVNIGEFGAALR